MKAPGFWFRPPGLASLALSPLAAIWTIAARRRQRSSGEGVGALHAQLAVHARQLVGDGGLGLRLGLLVDLGEDRHTRAALGALRNRKKSDTECAFW